MLISTDTSLKINEYTKIWVNNIPNIKLDNNDYLIKNTKYSINSVSIGLTKRVTSGIKDFWLSNNGETPYKVRLNTEVDDNVINVYVDKNDNITIDENTLIWFNKDYSETLDDYNYIYTSKYSYKNMTKYIISPMN